MSQSALDDLAGASDRALLEAHVAGDPEAFGVLFARHRDRLWAVALRTTGNREDAADALQDAMISAFRRAAGFRGDSGVTTWLHRVVVNACLDRLRRRAVRAADPLPEDADRAAALAAAAEDRPASPVTPSASPDPATAAERAEVRRRVVAALGSLPPDQRAALVLVDMEGYSVEETARILECAPGTVKSRCSRGRARLAPLLGDLLGQADPTDDPAHTPPATLAAGNREPASRVPSTGPPDPRTDRRDPSRPSNASDPTSTSGGGR